jgi:hypothetical protein
VCNNLTQIAIYVNQYYEKNLASGVVTAYYYLGGQEIAYETNNSLRYVLQDMQYGLTFFIAADAPATEAFSILSAVAQIFLVEYKNWLSFGGRSLRRIL